jgi:hypothetical protein
MCGAFCSMLCCCALLGASVFGAHTLCRVACGARATLEFLAADRMWQHMVGQFPEERCTESACVCLCVGGPMAARQRWRCRNAVPAASCGCVRARVLRGLCCGMHVARDRQTFCLSLDCAPHVSAQQCLAPQRLLVVTRLIRYTRMRAHGSWHSGTSHMQRHTPRIKADHTLTRRRHHI